MPKSYKQLNWFNDVCLLAFSLPTGFGGLKTAPSHKKAPRGAQEWFQDGLKSAQERSKTVSIWADARYQRSCFLFMPVLGNPAQTHGGHCAALWPIEKRAGLPGKRIRAQQWLSKVLPPLEAAVLYIEPISINSNTHDGSEHLVFGNFLELLKPLLPR